MSDLVFPSTEATIDRFVLPGIVQWAGGDSDGWTVPSGTKKLAAAARNAFGESSSGASLDVTIDTGEGFVGGGWIDRDATTPVTLAASTADQIVYAGWDRSLQDTVIVGLAAAFAAEDAKMAIWQFDTDATGVTSATDLRVQKALEARKAPSGAGYLVTEAHDDLDAEVVVGATPGGELGGTWGAPTVDATHSGSAHHARAHGTGDHDSTVPTLDDVKKWALIG